jgi:predicted TIM-barrel fold metal-dependent hydrolase
MEWIDGNTFFGTWPKRKLDVPSEELVRLLKEAGTSRALTLSLVAPLLDAVEGNNLTRLASIEHRELLPFGAVDPRKYTGTGAVRQLRELGCAALRITNRINAFPLDIAPVELILTECAHADLTAFVDVTGWGECTTLERLAASSGCRVVMCGVHYSFLSEAIVCMKRSKLLYAEISRLNTPDGVRVVCSEAGPERVLFGSGAPFNYASSAHMVAEHNRLTDQELDWVSSRTLMSLLTEEHRP